MRTRAVNGANGRIHIKLGDLTRKGNYGSGGLPITYNKSVTVQTTLISQDSEKPSQPTDYFGNFMDLMKGFDAANANDRNNHL